MHQWKVPVSIFLIQNKWVRARALEQSFTSTQGRAFHCCCRVITCTDLHGRWMASLVGSFVHNSMKKEFLIRCHTVDANNTRGTVVGVIKIIDTTENWCKISVTHNTWFFMVLCWFQTSINLTEILYCAAFLWIGFPGLVCINSESYKHSEIVVAHKYARLVFLFHCSFFSTEKHRRYYLTAGKSI